MARTPLADALGRIVARVAVDDEEGTGAARGPSRRRVLAGAGALAGGLAAPALGAGAAPARAAGDGGPRILVVGAGLAGLSAAYRLTRAGLRPTVIDAADRLGGRCWSMRPGDPGNPFAPQVAEHGGELIDQGHTNIRRLAQELGLGLDNLLSAEENGTEPLYFFDGAPYTYAEATDDMKTIWQQLHKDVSAASYPTLYDLSTPRGRELDQMSIAAWIDTYVPGGRSSRLGQLLDVAYTIEYGGDSDVQSSLNMLYLLAYSGQGQLRIFGPSNEKYHVRGGNDQIVERMAAGLRVNLGTALTALRDNGDGTWAVTTTSGARTSTTTYDRVILALPFSLLREVDLRRANFGPLKMTAIRELPMGTNTKLALQFGDRVWRALGNNGDTYADTGYQATWEVTRGQDGGEGILVDYTGGTVGADFGRLSPDGYARRFLGQVEPVLPGLTSRWNGRVALDYWTGYRWTKGSYSYWKVGQYTGFSGVEKEARGTCHFAGEHTSQDFQGYLEGAVETGYRAAAEVLDALG